MNVPVKCLFVMALALGLSQPALAAYQGLERQSTANGQNYCYYNLGYILTLPMRQSCPPTINPDSYQPRQSGAYDFTRNVQVANPNEYRRKAEAERAALRQAEQQLRLAQQQEELNRLEIERLRREQAEREGCRVLSQEAAEFVAQIYSHETWDYERAKREQVILDDYNRRLEGC